MEHLFFLFPFAVKLKKPDFSPKHEVSLLKFKIGYGKLRATHFKRNSFVFQKFIFD